VEDVFLVRAGFNRMINKKRYCFLNFYSTTLLSYFVTIVFVEPRAEAIFFVSNKKRLIIIPIYISGRKYRSRINDSNTMDTLSVSPVQQHVRGENTTKRSNILLRYEPFVRSERLRYDYRPPSVSEYATTVEFSTTTTY